MYIYIYACVCVYVCVYIYINKRKIITIIRLWESKQLPWKKGQRDFSPLFRKSWFYLFNVMQSQNCTTFSARSLSLFFQRLLKSPNLDLWGREMPPPWCVELHPGLPWISSLKVPFPLSHFFWGKMCQNQREPTTAWDGIINNSLFCSHGWTPSSQQAGCNSLLSVN